MELHIRLLKQHHQLDRFYEKPLLYGELTNNPLVVTIVPMNDWDSISEKEKVFT